MLESRLDGLWLPSGASTRAGFVPAVVERCGTCDGVGSVSDRFGRRVLCSRCGGVGRVAFDPMDSAGVPVGSASTVAAARPRRSVRCDRCDGDGVWRGERCSLCDGEGRRDLHAFELRLEPVGGRGDPVDEAIEARRRAGSYAELDRALEQLRSWSAIRWGSLLDEVDRFGVPQSTAATQGLTFVVERMPQPPEPIRVPAQVLANARELREWRKRVRRRRLNGDAGLAVARRDAEIRMELRRGRPVQWVAREFGLSVSRVYQIRRGEAA